MSPKQVHEGDLQNTPLYRGAAVLLAALTLNRRIAWNDCYVSVQREEAFYAGKPIRHLA